MHFVAHLGLIQQISLDLEELCPQESVTEIPDDSIVKLKQDIYTPIPEDTTLPDPERFVELVRDVQQNACMFGIHRQC
jgi:hypothetical protein